MITKMLDLKLIGVIIGIIFTASILFVETSVTSFVGNTVTNTVEDGVGKAIPQSKPLLQAGNTIDEANTYKDDTQNVQMIASGKAFTNTMTFGLPIMVVIGAIVAIIGKLR